MRLYKKTGCRVFLVGCLKKTPVLQMNEKGEFFATLIIDRKKTISDKLNQPPKDDKLSYRVFASGESTLRVRQFGFVGLHLWIEGDFQNTGEILAEKMSFLNFPESGEVDKARKSESIDELTYHQKFELSFIEDKQFNLSKFETL